MSLARRGIRGAAITEAMTGLGTSTSDVDLPMSTIYANNRDLVDDESERRFFVRDGLQIPLAGSTPLSATPQRHPDHENRGSREIPVGETVLLEADDLPADGERVWLKSLGCFRYVEQRLEVTDDDIAVVREGDVDVVHWVPGRESVPVRMRTPDGDVAGRAEPAVGEDEPGTVVQFERIGFVRVDRHDEAEGVVYYTHP